MYDAISKGNTNIIFVCFMQAMHFGIADNKGDWAGREREKNPLWCGVFRY